MSLTVIQFGLSFAYDAPKIWNELPEDVRSATSIATFRNKLIYFPNYLFSSLTFSTCLAFSVVSTIAMDMDKDFRSYAHDVAPYSLSFWQRLSAIKVELEL